ncbi:AAA family ATPase [Chloroflexi bacterium TSY]|nr:AAA family ATPase [Chloroflexi bacterium TSY]
MSTPILATKLYIPPHRPNIVRRPRLIERLNEGLRQNQGIGRKLTLISAPAGFGKTTLVSEWLTAPGGFLEQSVGWLSLDEGDNDPTRFLAYLVAALQTLVLSEVEGIAARQSSVGNIGEGVLAMLHSPQPPPIESILTALLNEITAIPDDFILVLDDYHVLDAQPVDKALTFLLEYLPPQLHLVITTREDPDLPLARYRVRGQLTELRATDLRFTPAEAAAFLNQVMGLNLSAEDIAALETRTEGWIAGLQMAALALQGISMQGISIQGHQDATSFIQSFSGSHHFVLDYLIEEVLQQQSENVQTFLLHTSILNQLTDSLCDAVCSAGAATGLVNGQTTLGLLERANLFIVPLDTERRWYRYHHLFADLLRQRLLQTQPEQLPTLHRRASEWYEQQGFVDEAIEHALRGDNFEQAAILIEDQFDDNYERNDQILLQRWLAEMPEELVLSRPHLCILHAWNLFSFGQLDSADRSLLAAEKMLDPNTDQTVDSSLDKNQLSDTNRMKLLGRIAGIRSFLVSYRGDPAEAIRYALQALEYLPEQELGWRSAALITLGDAYATNGQMAAAHKAQSDALVTSKSSGDIYALMIVNLSLAEALRQQGKLQQVIESCERQLKRADESAISESALVGWLFGIWGEVLAELNHLDRAIDQAKKGVKLTARGKDVMYIALSNLYLVRVLFSSGDITGAEDVIQSMENAIREYDLPHKISLQLSTWQVRIWLAHGKLEVAAQWAAERELDPDGELTYLYETEYIVFARILIAQGRLDEAARLLQRLLEAAEAGGRTSRGIEILLLQTLAAQSGGDTARAMSTLEQALTLAEPGGFIRIFVDEGPSMARLLYEALSRGIAPDYVHRLLGAFPIAEPEQMDSSKP